MTSALVPIHSPVTLMTLLPVRQSPGLAARGWGEREGEEEEDEEEEEGGWG